MSVTHLLLPVLNDLQVSHASFFNWYLEQIEVLKNFGQIYTQTVEQPVIFIKKEQLIFDFQLGSKYNLLVLFQQ